MGTAILIKGTVAAGGRGLVPAVQTSPGDALRVCTWTGSKAPPQPGGSVQLGKVHAGGPDSSCCDSKGT